MDEALDQVADGFVPRGLAPHWYLPIYLPFGLTGGFVGVTMGYLLAHHGVSVAAVAALLVLYGLPTTWKFAMGPVLDTSLSPPKWYLINLAIAVAALVALAFTPLSMSSMPLLSGLALLMGVAMNAMTSSATAGMALTTPNEQRGAVAGWLQCGQLGGAGLGGGLGLWLAEHAGGQATAALVLAGLCALCALPILHLRVPPRLAGVSVRHRLLDVVGALWTLTRTRTGVLAILANVLPASLGAATTLLPTVAGDWHASADTVALVLGAITGIANLPGCIIGGYLCDIFPRRTVYVLSALACALGEAAMAFGPHTPLSFGVFAILNAVLLGLSWAAVSAVCFEQLGARAAATVAAVLSSISNLPVVIMVAIVGSVQGKHGSTGMLLVEAAFGVASVVVYVLIASVWKSAPAVNLNAAPAPA
ncbi:MFS transporter [Phenylobacterium sp.]|jgi:MFS family permease|uniref:MFS transporter n=1 Tax=Phenylobacterium sp. TaxID=1871053 RepID=UPI002E360978|nr:MFS transporter [Phenylobacterium sp.]HEX3366586.1 MFS transporter [Phenylobacterium sp.]